MFETRVNKVQCFNNKFCDEHYQDREGDMLAPRVAQRGTIRTISVCSREDCTDIANRYGLCQIHYNKLCKFDRCESNKLTESDYCRKHSCCVISCFKVRTTHRLLCFSYM